MALTDEEKFMFDLEGYVVLKNVLTRAECEDYIQMADAVWPPQPDDDKVRRTEKISQWGQPFLDLIDHPLVLPHLVELLGNRMRADHDYCIFMDKGGVRNQLHGGPRLFETDHWYHYQDGVMRNGLTVATWNLTDAPEGAGGFTCVPGSHKSTFMRNLPDDVRRFDRSPHYVRQPPMEAGDVLIFTEALIHGTQPWQADHQRRTLLFKYSPPHSTWTIKPYDIANYPGATDQQKRLMAPPSVEAHPLVMQPDADNEAQA
jgi:hypothetical protein